MVQAAAPALHSIGTGEGNIFSFVCPLDFVAFALHKDDEIFLAGNTFHCLTNVVHQAKLPALTFLRRTVFSGGHFLTAALILGQDTEAVSHTDIITDTPQILQSVGILPELQTGFEIHGVDDEVGVDVFGGDKLKFSVDAYDPNSFRLRSRLQYEIAPNTYLFTQVNDINRSADRAAYVGLRRSF